MILLPHLTYQTSFPVYCWEMEVCIYLYRHLLHKGGARYSCTCLRNHRFRGHAWKIRHCGLLKPSLVDVSYTTMTRPFIGLACIYYHTSREVSLEAVWLYILTLLPVTTHTDLSTCIVLRSGVCSRRCWEIVRVFLQHPHSISTSPAA